MTIYCARYRFHNTGQISVGRYESATEREIAIMNLSQYADVLDRWETT